MATQQQPPHSGFALLAFVVSAGLLGYAALQEKQQVAPPEPAPVDVVAPVVEEAPQEAPPFTPAERDAAQRHLNLNIIPAAVRIDLFTEQTETFPVQLSDITEEGSVIWNGPYLESVDPEHPIALLWGSNPEMPGMSACGLDPAFNLDCFLWMSVENYPQSWFRVLDMQYDENDGELAGRVRYDDKARKLILEYRTLLVQPETEEQAAAVEETLAPAE